MRVFVECSSCEERIYLDEIKERRSDYPPILGLSCSNCNHEDTYKREQLEAEPSDGAAAAGAILGGVAGTLAGPIGVALGAGIGGALGSNADQEEKEKVERFYDDETGPFEV